MDRAGVKPNLFDRRFAASLLALVALNTVGCTTMQMMREAIPNPDLNVLKLGASRAEVESGLGKPTVSRHNVSYYQVQVSNSRMSGGMAVAFLPMALLLDMMGAGLIAHDNLNRMNRLNTQYFAIAYGPEDRVISLSHMEAQRRFREWLQQQEQPDLLAVSAREGYAPAQFAQAMRYRYGLWNTTPDPVRAYAWARLAEFGGHPGASETAAGWAKRMQLGQIAEGERRFRSWTPHSEPDLLVGLVASEPRARVPGLGAETAPGASDTPQAVLPPMGPSEVLVLRVVGQRVEPSFLSVQDFDAAIREVTQAPAKESEAVSQSVCVIARDGRYVDMDLSRKVTETNVLRRQITPAFRADATALMRLTGTWSGGYVCGLQLAKHWPQELRYKVADFFEAITVGFR